MSSRETFFRAQGLPDLTTDPVRSVVREMSEQEAHGKKQTILRALRTYGMAQDVATLSSWTRKIGKEGSSEIGMNPSEIAKLLWAMQKAQLVTFKERAGGLFKIRMTDVAAATFKQEKRGRQPVERVVEAKKPEIIPSVVYRVTEPPRYAAPPPPAQNVKLFTDEETASAHVSASSAEGTRASAEVTERNAVVDTHTQYQPEVKHNLYPDNPKSKAGMISQRTAARFIDGLDKIGGRGTRRDAARAVGINTNSRPTTISQAAEHWGWIKRDGKDIALTDVGRDILRQYRRSEHGTGAIVPEDKIPEPRRSVRAQMNGVEAMEVVARDVADAEPKEPEIDRDTYNGQPMAPNLDQFPLIKDLMGKEERLNKYTEAARLLEDDDEAADIVLALLEKIQITDLEREVIRFVRSIMQ